MIQDNVKFNKDPDNYEMIEADIIEVFFKDPRGDTLYATIEYVYNGMSYYDEVHYYDKEDSGKSTIQIAVNKKTGEVYRPGMHLSYAYISRIVVALCCILLIFAKVYEDKKEHDQAVVQYAKKLYERQIEKENHDIMKSVSPVCKGESDEYNHG